MWQRILIGEEPLTFLGEVLLRTLIVYAFLTLIMRSLGKRMGGQISNLELGVMLSLGAIVSLPMQVGQSGVLPAAVLLVCLLGLQRGLTQLMERSPRVERLTQGSPSILVIPGGIPCTWIHGERSKAAASPAATVQVGSQPPLDPPWDAHLRAEQHRADGVRACAACGHVSPERAAARCPRCAQDRWERAVYAQPC